MDSAGKLKYGDRVRTPLGVGCVVAVNGEDEHEYLISIPRAKYTGTPALMSPCANVFIKENELSPVEKGEKNAGGQKIRRKN